MTALSGEGHCHAPSCETLDKLSEKICADIQGVTCSKYFGSDMCWLIVSQPHSLNYPDIGPLDNPRICLTCDGTSITYQFQVFLKTIESGEFDSDRVYELCQQILPSSEYVICPGIPDYPKEIHFKTMQALTRVGSATMLFRC